MGKWEDIRNNVSRVAGNTIRKTEEMAGNATMYMKLSSLKTSRNELYEKLGRLTYKQLKIGESQADAISKVVSDLDKTNIEIAKQRAKIEKAKAEKERRKEEKKMAKEEADRQAEQACVNEIKVIVENTPMGEPVNFEEQ